MAKSQSLLVRPDFVDFGGKVITEAATRASTLTLSNNGSMSGVRISGAEIVGPESSSFSIVDGPSDAPLPSYSQETTLLGVAFHPQRLGIINAELQIVTENPVSTYTYPLTGTGLEASGSTHLGRFTGLGPGQSTIGPGGDYHSLATACTDVSNKYLTGGDWEFQITDDLSEVDSSWLGVHHTNGHTITFKPAPGTQPAITFAPGCRLTIGAPADSANGLLQTSTRNITIDGSADGGGTDRSLTITNTGENTSGPLIRVFGDADSITLRNLNVYPQPNVTDLFSNDAITFYAELGEYAVVSAPAIYGQFPDDALVENCDIKVSGIGPGVGILYTQFSSPTRNYFGQLLSGAHGFVARNNTIRTNGVGISLYPMGDAVVSSNSLVARLDYDYPWDQVMSGISISGSPYDTTPANFEIVANSIKLLDGETTHSFSAISYQSIMSDHTDVLIANNMISGITAAAKPNSPGFARFGISVFADKSTTAVIVHNSVEMTGHEVSTTANQTAAIGTRSKRHNGPIILKNNIIRMDMNGGTVYRFLAGSGPVISDNNNIFKSANTTFAVYENNSTSTMEDWRKATGNDISSFASDPFLPVAGETNAGTWTGPAGSAGVDLHFTSFPGDAYVAPGVEPVFTDIDGQPRELSGTVIGADEVDPEATGVESWMLY